MRLAVVVHIHNLGNEVLHDLSDQDSIREIPGNAPLRPAQGNLVDPVVDHLEVLLCQVVPRCFLLLRVLGHHFWLLLHLRFEVIVVVVVHFEFS